MKNLSKLLTVGVVVGVMALSLNPVFAVVGPSGSPTPEPTVTTSPAPSNTPKAYRTPYPTRGTTVKRAEYLEKAKESILKLFNRFITKLNDIKTNVRANERLGDEGKAAIFAEIDVEIDWINAQIPKVESATSVEGVRKLASSVKEHYAESVRKIRKMHISAGYVNSLEQIIVRLDETLIPKTADKLESLAERGVDISEAERYLALIQSEVDAAQALIPQIRNAETFESAKELFGEAKDHLGESRTLFKSLVESLREQIKVLKEEAAATATPVATETVVVE